MTTTAQDTAFDVDAWRDSVIKQLTEGDTEVGDNEEDLARLAHALHDFRIRDTICHDVVTREGDDSGLSETLQFLALRTAMSVPLKERADAYVVVAICWATIGSEDQARKYARLALESDTKNNMARLMVISYLLAGNDLTAVVPEAFSELTADECRKGVRFIE